MSVQKIHRGFAALVFCIAFVTYLLTTYPSLSFWDCGEFIATTHSLSVPHAPGAPFFALYAKVISILPFVDNYAMRINIVSCFASALTVMLVYLIGVILIRKIRKNILQSPTDVVITCGSAAVGALALAWSDTFWFNAIEAEVYASSMLFMSLVIWLALLWYEKADQPHSERYLVLVFYLLGLSIGVHQLSLLAYFGIVAIYYFRHYEFTLKSASLFSGAAIGLFFIIYPGIVLWLPNLLDGKIGSQDSASIFIQLLPLVLIVGALYGLYESYRRKLFFLNLALLSLLLVLLGYSTYTIILIRAGENPPINEVNPSNIDRMVQYLNREQYGDTPLLKGATYSNRSGQLESEPSRHVWFPRRWSPEEHHTNNYKKYRGDGDYFLKYQLDQMFLRYFFWNFIGRAGDTQDAPAYLSGAVTDGPDEGSWSTNPSAFPNAYYGIPFLLGLIGLVYHTMKDWKMSSVFFLLFFMFGFVLVFYFNMAQPQPRERDYFYVGAFLIFALWISIGTSALLEFLQAKMPGKSILTVLALALLLIVAPLNMAKQNWFDHDHSEDWTPWELAYNTLQSCEKDAILFTNGDNDTFPLWYLQEVEGVRRDIRIVCLSLVNTDWYSLQLKNERPYGALQVPVSFTDEQIKKWSTLNDESVLATSWRTEKKVLSLPVSASVMQTFKKENSAGFPEGSPSKIDATTDTVMKWTSSARFPIQNSNNDVLYVRQWQDIMTEDIIKMNAWKRPIYFAVTCTQDAFIGLDNFLRMEGLALRLTPIEGTANIYIHYEALTDQLFHEPQTYSQQPQRGLIFRSVRNPHIYHDDNSARLMVNYRNAFLRLSLFQLQVAKDNAATVRTIDKMFETIPTTVLPLDYRMQYDIASLYLEAGSEKRYRELAFSIENRLWKEVARNPIEVSSVYSPYRYLLEMYQQAKQYRKAVAVLDTILKYHPNAQDVLAKREELNKLSNNQQ